MLMMIAKFFKCSFNGLGSSSLKKSFINVFCKTLYLPQSGNFSIFEFLFKWLFKFKCFVLKFYKFSKMIRFDYSQIWHVYIRCELNLNNIYIVLRRQFGIECHILARRSMALLSFWIKVFYFGFPSIKREFVTTNPLTKSFEIFLYKFGDFLKRFFS